MRIAVVSPYDLEVPGGVQSHVRQLGAWLVGEGDRVVLLGPGPVGVHDRGTELPWVGLGGTRGVAFNGSVAPVALSPSAIARTRQVLRDLAPDVVHVHEPLVPVVGPAAALAGVAPQVVTFHAWSTSDRAYRLARPLGARVLAATSVSLAVSTAAAGYHAGALGVDEAAFRVVPNGVDVARFAAARTALGRRRPPGPPRVVFVGRLEPRKGALVLAEAVVRLRESHPDLHLTVVGDGPQRDELARVLSALPAEQVTLAGRVDGAVLARALAEADVAVAPALGGESFGIVLLEAMAAGTAVIASDIPGYRSVITDGRDGVLVPRGSPDDLAGALGSLLDDPARRERLVAAGTRTAHAHDWHTVAATIRRLYREAVDIAAAPGTAAAPD